MSVSPCFFSRPHFSLGGWLRACKRVRLRTSALRLPGKNLPGWTGAETRPADAQGRSLVHLMNPLPAWNPHAMLHRLALSCCFAALVALTALPASLASAKEPICPKDETIQLFNGRDLSGWYTYLKDTKYEDPRKVFTVHDGMVHISGDGLGCITTKEAYRDYHLVAEWKWGERTWGNRKKATKDSGILVHCTGRDGGYSGIWMASIEAQIIQGGCGDFIVVAGNNEDGSPVPLSITAEVVKDRDGEPVWHKGGERQTFTKGRVNWYGRDPDWKDTLGFRGPQEVEKPDGEWNRMEVICDGDRITVLVNGVVVNEAFDVVPHAGKIIVQTELAEIYFRKIELQPLKKK